MPSYKLSEEAALDVEFIIDDGLREFGINQALKYHLGLESRFELLAQFPRIGLPTYDVRPGLYRYPLTTFALKAGEWFRRGLLLIAAPDSRTSVPVVRQKFHLPHRPKLWSHF